LVWVDPRKSLCVAANATGRHPTHSSGAPVGGSARHASRHGRAGHTEDARALGDGLSRRAQLSESGEGGLVQASGASPFASPGAQLGPGMAASARLPALRPDLGQIVPNGRAQTRHFVTSGRLVPESSEFVNTYPLGSDNTDYVNLGDLVFSTTCRPGKLGPVDVYPGAPRPSWGIAARMVGILRSLGVAIRRSRYGEKYAQAADPAQAATWMTYSWVCRQVEISIREV